MPSFIPKPVQRYRRHNPYSHTGLFTLLDVADNVAKVSTLALLVWGAYLAKQHWLPGPLPEQQAQTPVAAKQPAAEQLAVISANENRSPLEQIETTKPAANSKKVALADTSSKVDELNILEHTLAMQWLQAQDVSHLVVQFASSPDKDALADFARENFQSEALIYAFKRTQTNQPVYGLASGLYPDFETAQQAVAGLPETLRDYKPWIRPIEGLLDDMKNTL